MQYLHRLRAFILANKQIRIVCSFVPQESTSVSSLYLEIQYNVYKRCLVYAIWRQMEKKHCIALDIQLRAEVIIIHAMQEDKFCC